MEFVDEWKQVEARVARWCRNEMRDPDHADEVLQRTRIRAWDGYAGFQRRSAFATWVLTIARNEVHRFRAAASRFTTLDAIEGELEAPPEPTAEAEASSTTLTHAIADAHERGELSALEAAVLKARLADEDAAWADVAQALSITANSCAVLHFRAMAKLRVFLFRFHPQCMGGEAEIVRAFEAARVSGRPARRLTDAEAMAFRTCILGSLPRLPRGMTEDLRAACVKVALQVERP